MEVFLVYLWLKLDSIMGFFWVALIALAVACMFTVIAWGVESTFNYERAQGYRKTFFKLLKYGFPLVVIPLITLPTSNQAAVLVGTHYAVKLAESPEGLKVQSLIRKKANEFLDEQLKEVQK